MNFELTETQRMIQQTAREFAQKEVRPLAEKVDREHYFPKENVKRMAELGFLGMFIPEQWNGTGLDAVSYVLAMEEISAACATTGVIMSVNNSLVSAAINDFGTDEQKEKWLKPLACGEKLGCFCLSEPNTGSDAAAQRTRAEKKGDKWVLNGSKNWITNGPFADTALVMAMTDPDKGVKGITAFVVDCKTPGYQIGKIEDKLGIRGSATCQIILENCELSDDQVLGQVGGGFKVAMKVLDGGRIGIASQALGIGRAAYEAARDYAKEREAFGVPIAEHQAVAFYIADMGTRLEAARLLTLKAAFLKDSGGSYGTAAAMAKVYASEAANWIATKAIQVHGGNGYSTEYPVERHFRDAKITEIYEGTSEIQRVVISRALLK
ncbi:MAG: acyl-CoA dehydrogenase [Chrysiogenetes bacterium]|nr:acyl-CoA dehydrogenase [Chrysiogenetes bacterium]